MYDLHVDGLGHRFGRRVLFRDVGFTLLPGEALAVTGANGSGKSTLVRILAGVLRPTKGRAVLRLDGRPVGAEAQPRHVGLVAPYLGLYDDLTARENLAFLARARRLADAPARIDAVLAEVELTDRGDDRVGTFSSGMRQRVRVATALLAAPPLLLLDEPTSNLDAPGIAMVRRVMAAHRASGRLLVLATNDPGEAGLCERALSVEAFR